MKPKISDFTKSHHDRVVATITSLNWADRDTYGDFLAQTYHHICHSTRLLAAAGARFGVDQDQWHLQCMKHAGEERSHEKLSLTDLQEIGRKLSDYPELPGTKALYRSAYYLIEHVGPITLFGYAYFLERMGIEAARIQAVAEPVFGAKAVKHCHVHSKEDPAHIEAYERWLDKLAGPERTHLEESIVTTAANYERIYSEIRARHLKAGKIAA